MKRIGTVAFAGCMLIMLLCLSACGNAGAESTASAQQEEATTESATSAQQKEETTQSSQITPEEADAGSVAETVTESDTEEEKEVAKDAPGNAGTLVAYFSATGTTRGVAETIAEVTGADVYEIVAKETYTEDDLNWHDRDSRTTHEQNDPACRPEIGSEDVSLDGYSTIYIGYPIWWGEEPRIMDAFVEKYVFDGITMIPFCTSGGSGIGRSGTNLADNAASVMRCRSFTGWQRSPLRGKCIYPCRTGHFWERGLHSFCGVILCYDHVEWKSE